MREKAIQVVGAALRRDCFEVVTVGPRRKASPAMFRNEVPKPVPGIRPSILILIVIVIHHPSPNLGVLSVLVRANPAKQSTGMVNTET